MSAPAAQIRPESTSLLAAWVRVRVEAAKRHFESYILPRLQACQQARAGEYSSDKLRQIAESGGSSLFFNVTDHKCSAAESWIGDLLNPIRDKIWQLSPTPLPDLPEPVTEEIVAAIVSEFQAMDPSMVTPELVQQRAKDLQSEVLSRAQKQAEKRVQGMESLLVDQFTEGGFYDALTDFVRDLSTYPLAVLKGPVVQKRKKFNWVNGVMQVSDEPAPFWYAVSPFDWYPAPSIRSLAQGYCVETITLDPGDLYNMIGVEGYSEDAIRQALAQKASEDLLPPGESEREQIEGRASDQDPDAPIKAVEFWGPIPGTLLADWGMPGIDDLDAYYHCVVTLIDHYVVRAIRNPDPLGRPPYYVTSFEKTGSIVGRAIPEKMGDCQDAINGCLRNLINNLAFSAGPMYTVDVDAIAPGEDPTKVFPLRCFQYNGTKSGNRNPITFFQPSSNAQTLLQVADFFQVQSDDRTLIPRYTHGNENIKGAGSTYGGLSMLMDSAAKGIMQIMANIDKDVVRPAVRRQYEWNMLYHDDPSIKGDCRVVPHGIMSVFARQNSQIRRMEFLSATANDLDMQIIELRGRRTILEAVARELELPVEKIVPTEEQFEQKMQELQIQQQQAEEMEQARLMAEYGLQQQAKQDVTA